MNIANLSIEQLKRAVAIREQIAALEAEMNSMNEALVLAAKPGRRRMSAAARGRIAAGQRARWALAKRKARPEGKPGKRRKVSRAGRAAIAAAARARWARVRAEKAGAK